MSAVLNGDSFNNDIKEEEVEEEEGNNNGDGEYVLNWLYQPGGSGHATVMNWPVPHIFLNNRYIIRLHK